MKSKTTWRVLAILLTLAWIVVFFSIHAFTPSVSDVYSIIDSRFFYGMLVFLSIVLIIFPLKFYLYAVIFFSWGLLHLFYGDSFGSMLVYFLGFLFAMQYKMFCSKKPLKIFFLILPILTTCTQYRFGTVHLINSLLSVLLLSIVGIFVYVLYYDKIFTLKKIDVSNLTSEEVLITKYILDDKTLYAIAIDLHKSESTVKQQVTGIYKKLGLYNRAHLFDVHNEGKLKFLDNNKL